MRIWRWAHALPLLALVLHLPAAAGAQAHPKPPAAAPAAAKSGADPTDFITRIEPSYEHKRLDNRAGIRPAGPRPGDRPGG